MRHEWDILRRQTRNVREGMRACIADQCDVRHWPRYAVFLSLSVWLFGHLPVTNEAASVLVSTPLLALLACTVLVAGSALAVSLALVGIWQPGRASVVFSTLAVGIAAIPFV
jgi:hypothetical protein